MVQLVAAHIAPQLLGDRGHPGLLFLLTGSTAAAGLEVKQKEILCGFLAWPESCSLFPEELHSQSLDEGPGPAQPHVLDVSSHPLPSPPCSPHWLLLFAISQAVPSQGQRAEGFV